MRHGPIQIMPNLPEFRGRHAGATKTQKSSVSAKNMAFGRGLKIRVSAVRFCPWAPFI